jgi:hypothetical protein
MNVRDDRGGVGRQEAEEFVVALPFGPLVPRL